MFPTSSELRWLGASAPQKVPPRRDRPSTRAETAADVPGGTSEDRPHRGADAREPLVRPHARLPQPRGGPHRRRRPQGEHVEQLQRQEVQVRHLQRTALTKDEDPCHGGACIAEQVANNMGGFVKNFVKSATARRRIRTSSWATTTAATFPSTTTSRASSCVCDRWFCLRARRDLAEPPLRGRRPGRRQQRPKKVPVYDLPVRAPPRHEQCLLALVHTRRRDPPLQRLATTPRLLRQLRRTSTARASLAPRNFLDDARRRQAARGLLDRPELRRRQLHRPVGLNDDHPPSDVPPDRSSC